MEDTVFGKIIRKELPADIVYEDDLTLAFLDISPASFGHTLVVPKKQVRNLLDDIDDESLCVLIRTVKKVAHAVKEGTGAEGINIIMNNEAAAGQIVFHAHFHVVPRFEGDGLAGWPKKEYTAGQSEELAQKIRGAF